MKCFAFKVTLKEKAIPSFNVNGTLPGMKMAVLSAGHSSVVHSLVSLPSEVLTLQ